MKIVCEACAAKYSISDDKVRGKVFKIRCKKCSHIIVVRGNAEDGGVSESAPAESVAEAPALATAALGAEGTWYVVVEGEQVGPLTEGDVAGRIVRGELSSETFGWREGMADWVQLSAIAEFASVLASAPAPSGSVDSDSPFAPQPTAVYPPGTAESMFGADHRATPGPSLNGSHGRSEATEVFGSPVAMAQPTAGDDLFAPQSANDPFASAPQHKAAPAASVSSHGGGGGFFNVPSAASMSAPSGGGAGLTAQRSENSVLFSLSNLEALAAPGPAPVGSYSRGPAPAASSTSSAPVTEGSGLIDIRSMAAMTLGKQPSEAPSTAFGGGFGAPPSAPELPTFAAAPISPMSPMLVPLRAQAGVPKYVWALVGAVVLALGGLSYAVFTRPPPVVAPPAESVAMDPPAVNVPPPVPPTTPPPPPETPPAAKAAEEPLPPRDVPVAAAPVEKTERKRTSGGSKGSSGSSGGGASAKAEPEPKAAVPEAAPKPEPAAAPKKGSLDDLLAGAIGTPKKAAPTPAAAPPEPEPARKLGPLGKSDIVKGMMGVMPKTKACYDQYKVPGTASVTVKVGSSGRVDAADVTGKFAGTPTGDCVEKAVKTAKFPPSDGLTFPYPIPLR
ncbi:MAG: zinc-ribbon domain-containing protein [Myxococcales bacterium]|nr:zinc-ribbon domain-containing protein [Myxococcales bacterium]